MRGKWSTLHKFRDNCSSFFNQLFTCELCLDACEPGSFLCGRCFNDLPFPALTCPQCSEPSPTGHRCGRCQASPPAFDYSFCSFQYYHPLNHWMHRCKEGHDIRMAKRFASLMLTSRPLSDHPPDTLVFIPASRRRLLQRGFNLSEELCHHLSKALNIPVAPLALRRTSHSEQRRFSAAARRQSNIGLDRGHMDLTGRHVMIIDDVMTTGSTLEQAARLLKSQGASIVGAWCFARTVRAV